MTMISPAISEHSIEHEASASMLIRIIGRRNLQDLVSELKTQTSVYV
jgi:hypothetical protein